LLIPVAQYREKHVQYLQAKAAQRKLHARVQMLKKKNEPAHAFLKYTFSPLMAYAFNENILGN